MVKNMQDAISLIMPTIDYGDTFRCCVEAAHRALRPGDQLLIVLDGTVIETPDWLSALHPMLLCTHQRLGPAAARNFGAQQASHPILLFVDADVEVHPDAVDRIRAHFEADPELTALFGSYDVRPAAPGLVSRFRNLLHHYTHTGQPGPACTFWAGCGAVRRNRFLALGGFDADAYRQPCIEDVEFGLRLHDAGGRILLDPAIQGTHWKRWTLGLMVRTDIQQRAIPWSRLLLSRRHLPATLNFSQAARLSSVLSLLVLVAVLALAIPTIWPWPLLMGGGALAALLLLNRSFFALLLKCGGISLTAAGIPLLILYYVYSSFTFAGVTIVTLLNSSRPAELWKGLPPVNRRRIWTLLLSVLVVIALVRLLQGSAGLLLGQASDLHDRYDEWRLFRDGIYPIPASLVDEEVRSIPYFRTTVYLPWALPMFAGLFIPGGFWQGKLLILIGSLMGLAWIAILGWHCLRPWGPKAGWLGALAPLATMANSLALSIGQFSIICMALISLQWVLLRRDRQLPAALCWSFAMIKPQIALFYVLPLLRIHRLPALVLSAGLLLSFTTMALVHTDTSPLVFSSSWIRTLDLFIGEKNINISAGLLPILTQASVFILLIVLAAACLIVIRLGNFLARTVEQSPSSDYLDLAGFCAILGYLSFYHEIYDKIMLYPALLACLRISCRNPLPSNLLLCALMAATVWMPKRALDAVPGSLVFQAVIWSIVGIVLVFQITMQAGRVRTDAT